MAYNSRPSTLIRFFTESIQACYATWGQCLPLSELQHFHVTNEGFFVFLSLSPLLRFANEDF